uniref:Mitochondrial import receptor subunit TOM20 homolog n=1 Tax=Glossina brevipalpis TaxID=37001 RepID=A0A1A9WXQ9_9MUSC
MLEINKTMLGIAAGVIGTAFIGYCIYFDNKRRKDPDYKKKVRERRKITVKEDTTRAGVPNINNHEAIERYFLQEIQLGEMLIGRGEFDTGVEHLANALVVCGQPNRLMQVLQTTLPGQVFRMLLMKMQEYTMKAINEHSEAPKNTNSGKPRSELSSVGLETTSEAIIIDEVIQNKLSFPLALAVAPLSDV